MQLGQKTIERLNFLAESGSAGGPSEVGRAFLLEQQAGKVAVSVEIDDHDRYGVVLSRMELRRTDDEPAEEDVTSLLKRQAEAACERINYLMEDIRLTELDPNQNRAQLRSFPLTSHGDTRIYYDFELGRGRSILLLRYQKPEGEARSRAPMTLTKEVFERLIDDLADILGA